MCNALYALHYSALYYRWVGVGRDQYFRSSACSSMPSPSILGRDDDHNDDDDDNDDEHNDDQEGSQGRQGGQEVKGKGGEVMKT